MILNETYTLSDGIEIPKLGLGTWFIDDDKAAQAVRDAVKIGYRHFDSAEAYGNEHGVGEGVRTCGLPREEIFITTKLAAEMKTYEDAAKAIDESLAKMDIGYIDLMLIHSPQPWDNYRLDKRSYDKGNLEAWRALEDAVKAGKLRSIGVANFEQPDIDSLLAGCTIRPVVNQLLAHISNTPHELIAYSESKGMKVQAYSPIAHGQILKTPEIVSMAERYGVTVPQLCIRYTLQLGLISLPKTGNPEHMKSNAEVDFVISDEDMEILKTMEKIRDYGEFSYFPVFSGK
ncbi:MAG: aldo/keto reductase [Lachnospiraceae bacterium]|nr:aldo/keto reductase [Lachnospiraceae bacterium]